MTDSRVKTILKTSIIGIAINILLAGFKMLVGALSSSIAIILDGINNLSDAASSLITMIGTSLASKPADKKHPFGYGRMEYLTSIVIAGLVLYAGATALIESVKKIIHPEVPDYSTLTLILVAVAVIVKLALGMFTRRQGIKVGSDPLIASGKDAMLDVILSTSTLVAAGIYLIFGLSLEAYLGLLISFIIIKAGIELLMETVSKILGEPSDVQLAIDVKNTVKSIDMVNGAYDLVMNDYGPDNYTASIHVEVDEELTAPILDQIGREIIDKVMKEHGVLVTAVGFYSRNKSDERVNEVRHAVSEIVLNMDYIKGMHGFYLNEDKKQMSFDVVVSLEPKNRIEAYEAAVTAVRSAYPDYEIHVGFDMDLNEIDH